MKNDLNKQLSNLFIVMPRQFGRTKYLQLALYYEMCYTYGKELVDIILEEQDCSIDDVETYINKIDDKHIYYCDMRNLKQYIDSGFSVAQSMELFDEANKYQPSTTDQITSLKSQLKYCKNPLQKLNMEREMNRLIKERNRR